MTANTLINAELKTTLGLLQMTLGDFSDADMMARPTPAANHAAWQLAHVASFETMVAQLVAPGKAPTCPAGLSEQGTRKNAPNNDPAAFISKQQALNLIAECRAAITNYVDSAPAEDFDKPTPEAFRSFVPTMGQLLMAVAGHTTMHIGQFQVIRRALGKPMLF